MAKVNPSAFALSNWKLKSVVNALMLTGVVNHTAPLLAAAEAKVNCARLLVTAALPWSESPFVELNPLGKLIVVPALWIT